MARKKTLTIEERLNGAAATRDAALSVFQAAVDDLLVAEAEAHAAKADAEAQAAYFASLATAADVQAHATAGKANALREVFGL